MKLAETEYCKCENLSGDYSRHDDFGHWSVCKDCDKVIEDSYEYFNHYDGEDHCIDTEY